MAKGKPGCHICKHCAKVPLNFQITKRTEDVNFGVWKHQFASSSDLQKLRNHPGLEDFLRAQLHSFVWFASITPSDISDSAKDGCLLFQYIHDRIADTLAEFPNQLESHVEPMDPLKPFADLFYWRRKPTYSPFDRFFAWCYRIVRQAFAKVFGSRQSTENRAEEKIIIFIEPQIGQYQSTFLFRWFATPYRPFHAMYFRAPEVRRGCHITEDWVDVDPFQVVVSTRSRHDIHFPRSINYQPGHLDFLAVAKAVFETSREEDVSKPPSSSNTQPTMPSRLLKVHADANNEPTKVCLLETGLMPESVLFVALSYCWGGPQQLRLMTETKSQLIAGISIDSLPKTLKDATIVTTLLGISYLWIDALCIIQDDSQDLDKELALMPMIYGNAAITIVASRAESVTEGFLHERLPFKDTAEPFFALPCIEPCDEYHSDIEIQPARIFPVGDLIGYESPDLLLREADADGVPSNPLISRAWTYQERALSPRVIDFGLYGTRFRILDHEDGSEFISSDGWKDIDWTNEPRPPNMCLRIIESRSTAINTWQIIVGHSTSVNLTFPSDRLPAISAFARFFSPAFGGVEDYAAGIWKSSMPLGLLWQVVRLLNMPLDHPYDEQSLVPSWSWASLTSWVVYIHGIGDEMICADQDAEVIECQVQLKSSQVQFGIVTQGTLTMRGRLRPVRLSLERDTESGFDWAFFNQTPKQKKLRYTRVITNLPRADPEDRGLHKREYDHESRVFRDYKLPIAVTLDREHDVMESMIGDSSSLFALPIASIPANISPAPSNEGEKVEESPPTDDFGIPDIYNIRPVYGLLLLQQSENVYRRVALFRTLRFNLDDLVLHGPLEVKDAADWFKEQHEWLGAGEVQEFSII